MAERERLNLRAISGTALLFVVLAAFVGASTWAVAEVAGIPPDVVLRAPRSATGLLASLLWSLAWMVLAGLVAGRAARHREVGHAACVGLVLLAVGVLAVILGPSQESASWPPWLTAVSWALALPAALAGGLLAWALRVRRPTA